MIFSQNYQRKALQKSYPARRLQPKQSNGMARRRRLPGGTGHLQIFLANLSIMSYHVLEFFQICHQFSSIFIRIFPWFRMKTRIHSMTSMFASHHHIMVPVLSACIQCVSWTRPTSWLMDHGSSFLRKKCEKMACNWSTLW